MLDWTFDGQGEWCASSSWHVEGVPFIYKIQVCDDGTFDVSRSDSELGLKDEKTLSTLAGAKARCEKQEASLEVDAA